MREHIVLNQMRLFVNISFGGQIGEYSKQSEMTWKFGILKSSWNTEFHLRESSNCQLTLVCSKWHL